MALTLGYTTHMTSVMIVLQAILPQHLLSRVIGKLAGVSKPVWLKNALVRAFMHRYDIDLSVAECDDAAAFPDFNAFFTRALRDDARLLATSQWCHPADGVLSQRGGIEAAGLIQAKGRHYRMDELLAGSAEEAHRYRSGCFATTYLSPRDYHRVHMPIGGRLVKTRYVPGDLFSVNAATVQRVDGLLARNERLVCFFEADNGGFVLVLVGAMIVAGIATVWGGRELPGPDAIRESVWTAEEAPCFEKGEEMGRFFLGSTVVMVTETSDLNWCDAAGDAVEVRAALAV